MDFDPSRTPYEDKPHDIGRGSTITSAHMHAVAVQALAPALESAAAENSASLSAMDVGSGSGYVAAVLGVMLWRANRVNASKAAPTVVAVEIDPELAAQSVENLTHSRKRAQQRSLDDIGVFLESRFLVS